MARDTGFRPAPAATAVNNRTVDLGVQAQREEARKGVRDSAQLEAKQDRARRLEGLDAFGAMARVDNTGRVDTTEPRQTKAQTE